MKYVITVVNVDTDNVSAFVTDYPEKISETECSIGENETMFVNEYDV